MNITFNNSIKAKIKRYLSINFLLYILGRFKTIRLFYKNINFVKKKYFLVELVKTFYNKDYKIENFPIICNNLTDRKARVGNPLKTNLKILKILQLIF